MKLVARARNELRRMLDDDPGVRFQNHHERVKHRPTPLMIAGCVLGVVLLVTGFVMLFIPGPGVIVLALGLALFVAHSLRLAKLLDRTECAIRKWRMDRRDRKALRA